MTEPAPRKSSEVVTSTMLTHAEARSEQRLYWSRKTMAERLMAMWELNSRMAMWRGIDVEQPERSWPLRFVRHGEL